MNHNKELLSNEYAYTLFVPDRRALNIRQLSKFPLFNLTFPLACDNSCCIRHGHFGVLDLALNPETLNRLLRFSKVWVQAGPHE